jgi:hypothetical protein
MLYDRGYELARSAIKPSGGYAPRMCDGRRSTLVFQTCGYSIQYSASKHYHSACFDLRALSSYGAQGASATAHRYYGPRHRCHTGCAAARQSSATPWSIITLSAAARHRSESPSATFPSTSTPSAVSPGSPMARAASPLRHRGAAPRHKACAPGKACAEPKYRMNRASRVRSYNGSLQPTRCARG